jgi:hypothetical protein
MHANIGKVVAVFLLSVSWQCAQAQAQEQEDYLHASDRIQWEAAGLYDGRFRDGTPFQMELAYPPPESVPDRARNGFIQTVWYPRDYAGTPTTLRADTAAGAQMRLVAADEQGVASGAVYSVTLSPDHLSGHGVLSAPGSAGPREFTLRRSLPYVGIVVTRPAPAGLAAYSSYYREKGFVFSAVFPILDDPEADGWIRQQAGICRDLGECANSVRVLWRSPSLVSLKALAWGDSGGAHGVGHSDTRQYGIQSGTMQPLELDAFIDMAPACRQQVSAAIVDRLRARHMSWADRSGLDARRAVRFTPTPAGIAFHYDSYEAGPYAEGAPTVFVAREALGNCVKSLPAEY